MNDNCDLTVSPLIEKGILVITKLENKVDDLEQKLARIRKEFC